jgi:hypothetical protein
MGYLYKKALYGAYITSRLGIKKFHWVINTALEHWRPSSINRSTNTDFLHISFSQTLTSSALDGHRIIPQGTEQGQHYARANLQDLIGRIGAWMTHYHVFWPLGLDVVSDILFKRPT